MVNGVISAMEVESNSRIKDGDVQLCSEWLVKFKNSMIAKSDYTKRWAEYWDAYYGEYFKNANTPDYKSNEVSNYIFSIIETIRPIMVDNNPKFQAIPRLPEGMQYANDLHEVLDFEWDREEMSSKLYRELITCLVTGTMVFFLPWDGKEKNVRAIPVNPDNIFPDPTAIDVPNAGYIIYATYKHEGILQHMYPAKADKLRGGQVNYQELSTDDSDTGAQVNDQILVLEICAKDWEMEEEGDITPAKLKYPNGRVLTLCPEIGVVLADKSNPYKDGESPFELIKDYDVPNRFWGEGEVAQLLSPQTYMNELSNSIVDNAKRTANMPWVIDKNSGIGVGKIVDRPGLIIRKNPGSEVRREQPSSMPPYVMNTVEGFKSDMEQVSGIFDTVKGNTAVGVYTAQGILALQEAGQARIRLKVKLLELGLGRVAKKWYSRIQQFWKDDRFVRISKSDGSYDFRKFLSSHFKHDYDFKIAAGSTMSINRGAMLDLMLRLAQTQMPDGQPLVDREAVVEYLPQEVKAALLKRMNGKNQNVEQMQQQLQQVEQNLQQMQQQEQEQDKGFTDTLHQMADVIKHIKQQILQLQSDHDTMIQKEKEEQKEQGLKDTSYNSGFSDAEKQFKSQSPSSPLSKGELPDSSLQDLGDMDDGELKSLLEQHPELEGLLTSGASA